MRRPTSPSQLPAQARRRVERLVQLYEREAYRIYNLALRTTADRLNAGRATEKAFLHYLAAEPDEATEDKVLREAAVSSALAQAPRSASGKRRGRSATEKGRASEGDEMLAAGAPLTPPARAALALASIDKAGPAAIAAATETTEGAAKALLERAKKDFAATLGLPAEQLDARLGDWPWEEPPGEIWESLYPQAHRLLAEREAATASPKAGRTRGRVAGLSTRGGSALASRLLEGSRIRAGLRGRGAVWAFRLAALAIILVPAAVVGLAGAGGDDEGALALNAPGGGYALGAATGEAAGEEGDGGYDALTPKELDQLRLKELEQLRQYSKQQADQSLSTSERSAAAQEAEDLLALARQRLAEAERREQQVAAQEKQQKQTEPTTTAPTTPPAAPGSPVTTTPGKKRKKKGKKPAQQPTSPTIADCLYDPQSGTYICPESGG